MVHLPLLDRPQATVDTPYVFARVGRDLEQRTQQEHRDRDRTIDGYHFHQT
jgi:hypothetical protein